MLRGWLYEGLPFLSNEILMKKKKKKKKKKKQKYMEEGKGICWANT